MNPNFNADIEQAKLLVFEKNFNTVAQQRDTKLMNTPAISHVDIKGISNYSTVEKTELVDITGIRNPQKHYTQFENGNRRSVAHRYTNTYLVDNYDKAVTMITDPTSELFENLVSAKNRVTDQVVIKAATGNVLIGAPDEAPRIVTPQDDGVITITGTTKFDYDNVIVPAITNFKNNEIENDRLTLAISANEEALLLKDEKFINNRYTESRPVDSGRIEKVSNIDVVTFAGTCTGLVDVENPILPEIGGTRHNVIMAPDSIAFAVEVALLEVVKSPNHLNSWEISIDVYFKSFRKEGAKVQIITSTI